MHVSGIIITYRTHVSVRRLYQPLWKILLCNGWNMCTKVILGRDTRCQTGYTNKPTSPFYSDTRLGPNHSYTAHCNSIVVLQQTTCGFGGKVVSTLGKLCFATEETCTLRQFWKRHTLSKGQVNIDTCSRFHKQEEATATLCTTPPLQELVSRTPNEIQCN